MIEDEDVPSKGPSSAPSGDSVRGLRRSLTLVDLAAIGLNATVGSGIFLLPDDLFRGMGAWSPFAFALCVVGLAPIAWCFADAARRTSATGGPYEYARQEFGDTVGFGVGWMCFANAAFSFAAVASAAAAYAGRLFPALQQPWNLRFFALTVVAAFGALNYFGARPGAWAIRLFTFGKFAVLLLLVSVLLPELQVGRASALGAPDLTARGVASAVFVALFALQGFEVVSVPAGEAKSPEKKVPIAVLTTLLTAGALYFVIQGVLVFAFDGIASVSDAPLADAALGVSPSLGLVVAIGALISTLGFVSGSALGTPRYLFAMASHRHLPAPFSRLHARHQTPYVAIVVTCAFAAALVLPFDYRTLIGMSNVAVAVQYGATCFAVLRQGLRTRGQDGSTKRIVFPLLGASASFAICFAATKEELVFAAIALGFGLGFQRMTRRGAA